MKKTFLFLFLLLFLPQQTYAFNKDKPNNKFGIGLAQPQEEDMKRAAELLNSQGGKWGYVTLVIQENDRDIGKWQNIFNKLRELKLIPIIRLATKPEGAQWRRPFKEDSDEWVKFLDSLNWVVRDRYIVLFNEPNHGAEWGGKVDIENYAEVAQTFAAKLKAKNKDYFIMLAGLDAAAPSKAPWYEDEAVFLKEILNSNPQILDSIDGLASHSYPNHGYVGKPQDQGRNTVRNYQWELDYLKSLGVTQELPVFITETGWPHRESDKDQGSGNKYYSSEVAGAYTEIAYKEAWLTDDRVRAVTPFILNYQGEPFIQFSWVKPGEQDVYPHYLIVKNMTKSSGDPEIIEGGSSSYWLPDELLVKSVYHFQIHLKNSGQAIWDREEGYQLKLETLSSKLENVSYFFSDLRSVKPTEEVVVDLYLKTSDREGQFSSNLGLFKGNMKIMDITNWNFRTEPLPSAQIEVKLLPKFNAGGDDYELQIFDKNEQLVLKKKSLKASRGIIVANEVPNVALSEKYRVVILKPYYLPRQTHISFKKGDNIIRFEWMIPVDFNLDGHIGWEDIVAAYKNPEVLKLLLPSL